MTKKKEIDSYHYHEVMQMAFVFGDSIERHLQKHPACKKHKDLKKQIKKAIKALAEVYQLASLYQQQRIWAPDSIK